MSVPLIALIFWLVMTVAGLLIGRSGDRIGGRYITFTAATNSVGAAGMWLVGLGFDWLGYALMAFTSCVWMVVICTADRAVLRRSAPMLVLGGAAIATILLTELWTSASRETVRALLILFAVLSTAFLGWTLVSTTRLSGTNSALTDWPLALTTRTDGWNRRQPPPLPLPSNPPIRVR